MKKLLLALLICSIALSPAALCNAAPVQDERIDQVIAALSVEERVGQLIVVDFTGTSTNNQDGIVQLIRDYKIGGVYLNAGNANIQNEGNTPLQIATLTNRLQELAYKSSRHQDTTGEFFVPLFIAIDQEGDGKPMSHFRNGSTPIPSTMAIGATWKPEDAQAIGEIVGRELEAVGINLLLGPDQDVLFNPRLQGSGDMNIRVFGGDPFWVGAMGRAYIRGLHQGSNGRVLTVAKHFPGHGASDRVPDSHVPTVNKSLEQLATGDLVPFFNVTRLDPQDPGGVTDAMMPSHIRYRGLQGDASLLTRPISLDPAGMERFFKFSPLNEWRASGGLIVCDALGVGGIKEFYDPTLRTFPNRQIARDALMAGNDILPLINYAPASSGWTEMFSNIKDTLLYFREQYNVNTEFKQRADDALRHIVQAKLRVYPKLSFAEAQVATDGIEAKVGRGQEVVRQVARDALTLLYPNPDQLRVQLPSAPRIDDNILIMGCFDKCLDDRFSPSVITQTLLLMYGPSGNGQIAPERLQVIDFGTLKDFMDGRLSGNAARLVDDQIKRANWIILALTDYWSNVFPAMTAGRQFLSSSMDLRDKRVVAIAFHAPYYLEASEINRLNAYYAVYSKVEPSIEVALRAVFERQVPINGASPVNIDGIGYDLQAALQPRSSQPIKLTLISAGSALTVGDWVQVQTLALNDYNGHPVRDDMRVEFAGRMLQTDISLLPEAVTTTVKGIAQARFHLSQPGKLEISARYDGMVSEPMILNVSPLPQPTARWTPTVVASATVELPVLTQTPAVVAAATSDHKGASQTTPIGWVVASLVLLTIGVAVILWAVLSRRALVLLPQEYRHLSELYKKLIGSFNEEELRTLCFEMGVDYENLPAQGKAGKAREFILELERKGQRLELIKNLRGLRPNISWEDMQRQSRDSLIPPAGS